MGDLPSPLMVIFLFFLFCTGLTSMRHTASELCRNHKDIYNNYSAEEDLITYQLHRHRFLTLLSWEIHINITNLSFLIQ